MFIIKIKHFPSDFIVEEKINLKLSPNGRYRYFILEKKDYNTEKAVEIVSRRLGTDRINYSGVKDRRAVTKQYVSVNYPVKERDYDFGDIKLYYVGRGYERLNLGSHYANRFKITVRDIEKRFEINRSHFPNYFGDQRFSKNNIRMGKLLLEKKYNEIDNVPKRTLRMYVSSVQSFVFNMLLSDYVAKMPNREVKKDYGIIRYPVDDYYEDIEFPLMGFDSKAYFGINPKGFINKRYPFLTMDETMRKGFVKVEDFSYEWGADEVFGNNKLVLDFTLPKSSYATVFIESLVDQ